MSLPGCHASRGLPCLSRAAMPLAGCHVSRGLPCLSRAALPIASCHASRGLLCLSRAVMSLAGCHASRGQPCHSRAAMPFPACQASPGLPYKIFCISLWITTNRKHLRFLMCVVKKKAIKIPYIYLFFKEFLIFFIFIRNSLHT